jgi:hypothetical protein
MLPPKKRSPATYSVPGLVDLLNLRSPKSFQGAGSIMHPGRNRRQPNYQQAGDGLRVWDHLAETARRKNSDKACPTTPFPSSGEMMLLLSVRPVDAFEDQMFLQRPPGRTLFVNYCWIVGNPSVTRPNDG